MKKATKQLVAELWFEGDLQASGMTSLADMPPAAWKRGARSVSEAVVG